MGELRDNIPLFFSDTPDDYKVFLRLYYVGNDLYAFTLIGDSAGFSYVEIRIHEFSREFPENFTFDVPAHYVWTERIFDE